MKRNNTHFLIKAVIERLGGGVYTMIDYDDEDWKSVTIDTEKSPWTIEQDDIELTPEEVELVFGLVEEHIKDNTETLSDYDPSEHDPYRGRHIA